MLPTLTTSISNSQAPGDSSSISRLWTASTGLIRFTFRTLRELLHPPWDVEEISRQLYEIGWRSAPLIAVAGFVVGIVTAELISPPLVTLPPLHSLIPPELPPPT